MLTELKLMYHTNAQSNVFKNTIDTLHY